MLALSRQGVPPIVTLDPNHFKMITEFEDRFRRGIPSLIDCEKLEVFGDVDFSEGVICQGQVRIENKQSRRQNVEPGIYKDAVLSL